MSLISNIDTSITQVPMEYDSKYNWYGNDYQTLLNYLNTSKIVNLESNTSNNFSKIVGLINLYNYLDMQSDARNHTLKEIKTEIETYFLRPFIIGFDKKKIYGKEYEINYLKELQAFKLFKDFANIYNLYDQCFKHFITEIRKNFTKLPETVLTQYFISLLVSNNYGNPLIKELDQTDVLNMLTQLILIQINDEKDYKHHDKHSNYLLNLSDLYILDYKLSDLLNLENLKGELLFNQGNPKSTLDINIIQERIKEYSLGLINQDFPFDKNKFIIAGGFVINTLIGTISRYTDIDIYIFNDFKQVVSKIVSYLENQCKCKIKMTCNKTIINIYIVDYYINFQLIKINGTIPQIISDFDLSYSQVAILDWNNIQLTLNSYKSLLSGTFTLNYSAVIRNYRIVKVYIKGFKLDSTDYLKIINESKQDTDDMTINYRNDTHHNHHKLLEEVKEMIINLGEIHQTSDNDLILTKKLEHFLKQYYQKGSYEYTIMTKSIYLTSQEMNDKSEPEIIDYLENASKCNYFVISDLSKLEFENLKCYEEDYDLNNEKTYEKIYEKKDNNLSYSFPKMEDIILEKNKIKTQNVIKDGDLSNVYPLYVITMEYYRSSKSLSSYYMKMLVKKKDLKIIENNAEKSTMILKPNQTIKKIIRDLDDRCEKILYQTILINNQFDSNKCLFKRILNDDMTIMTEINNINLKKINFENIKDNSHLIVKLKITNIWEKKPNNINNINNINNGEKTFGYTIYADLYLTNL
jgi:hypothetical protein